MPLPPPATLSPGKVCLRYTTAGTEHEVCTNCQHDFDITDMGAVFTIADDLGDLVQAALAPACTITGWRLADPTGITLTEGVFAPAKVGTAAPGGAPIASDSSSLGLAGKGAPEVGLLGGQARFTIFPGYAIPAVATGPRTAMAVHPGMEGIRAYLDASAEVGSDFYGSFAFWRSYTNVQVNAHWQKTLGI